MYYRMNAIYVLNTLSIVVCLIILFNVTYGSCKKVYTESFTNNLNVFQSQLVKDVKQGKIDNSLIQQFIKENKISKKDVDNIVSFVSKYI